MIEEVSSLIRPALEKNANTLHIRRAPDLGMIHADQIKVRQALLNLLANAVKFTRDGNITFEADRESMDGIEWITFRITDTGIGLTNEQMANLFQDFAQANPSTTRKFGGTGLGLALTRRFCQMMGGDVTVRSSAGEGSVFTIKLPATVIEAKPEQPVETIGAESRGAWLDGGGKEGSPMVTPPAANVLVIDDEPAQRELIERFLTKEGFSVRTAATGEEGLRLARELKPDAITLDVIMPGLDGWSLLSALKAGPALRDIPVIMLTMVDDPARGFALGAADIVTTPVDRACLSKILKKYSCPHPPCPTLLVEDDPVTRELTRMILQKE